MYKYYFILISSIVALPQIGRSQSSLYEGTKFINDTNFISRSFDSTGYFARYIDTNRSCELYTWIGEPFMTGDNKEDYEEALQDDSNKTNHHYKFKLGDFPRVLNKLYLYKNNYCLWAPCDFEFNFRFALTDSTIVYGYAGGADIDIAYLKDFRKMDSTTYRLIEVRPKNETDTIIIKWVDRQKGIIIWGYDADNNTGMLMVKSDNVRLFPIIADECVGGLTLTNAPSDKPDFAKLLNVKQ